MVKVLVTISVFYLIVFFVSLPFVAWYKFCTRHLLIDEKKKTFKNFLGNLLTYYPWWP